MPTELRMPKLSDNMEQGTIIRWLKRPGDTVKRGEPLAEVETDKADVEVEASDAGVLREIRVREGQDAAVGDVIAVLASEGETDGAGAATSAAKTAREEAPAAALTKKAERSETPTDRQRKPVERSAAKTPERRAAEDEPDKGGAESGKAERPGGSERAIRASPLALRLAEDEGIDLGKLHGSGPGGRIVKRDVEAALEGAKPEHVAARQERPAEDARETGAASKPAASEAATPTGGVEEPSRMRKAIARRMTEAKREVPHFYVASEIDMSEAMRLREEIKRAGLIAELTVTHFILKAVAVALTRHPRANASWNGERIEFHDRVNIGIAVAVEDGLVVPVLHDAGRLSLAEIARRASALVEKARQGKFSGEDLTGGTFSVSNVGMIDVDDLVAVINPPQAAILATAAVKERPFVREGRVVAARTMRANLSCDHRTLNGVEGARFLAEVKGLLENPVVLVL